MKLIVKNSNYIIKGINEIESFEEVVKILDCFLEKDSMILFGCLDLEYFLAVNNISM